MTLRRSDDDRRSRRDGRLHPRVAPRRGRRPGRDTWWGKAWVRAVEEAAYAEADLRGGRGPGPGRARSAGSPSTPGRFLAAVADGDEVWTVSGDVPVLDDGGGRGAGRDGRPRSPAGSPRCWPATCRYVAGRARRGGRASSCCRTAASSAPTCTCDDWADPCAHALAVLQQLAWLVEADPFVLLQLRGLPRDGCWPGCTS